MELPSVVFFVPLRHMHMGKGVIGMNNDFKSRMARYEQELLQLRQRSRIPAPPPPSERPAPPPPRPPQPDRPAPPAPTPPAPERPVPPSATPPAPPAVRLRVVAAPDNRPIPGAVVMITCRAQTGQTPLWVRVTDRYGRVSGPALPPGDACEVTVAAPGYYRAVTPYAGSPNEQQLRLTPLPVY